MRCPYCGEGDDRVVDSRESREGAVIRRRRECNACQRRFTSYETVEEIPLLVVKKDGRREPFDRNKLLRGLMKACEKRPVETKTLEDICDAVESELSAREPREMTTLEWADGRLRLIEGLALPREDQRATALKGS